MKRSLLILAVLMMTAPAALLAAGNPDRRRGRQYPLDRFGSGCCPDGSGARHLYILQSPQMDTGYCARLCREYPGSHVGERESFLTKYFALRLNCTRCYER